MKNTVRDINKNQAFLKIQGLGTYFLSKDENLQNNTKAKNFNVVNTKHILQKFLRREVMCIQFMSKYLAFKFEK